jgi:hypothetical protein
MQFPIHLVATYSSAGFPGRSISSVAETRRVEPVLRTIRITGKPEHSSAVDRMREIEEAQDPERWDGMA